MEATINYQSITPFLLLTRDESHIIDELVDHHEMPAVLNKDHFISYFSKEDLHLVFYFSTEGDRGFQMFVIKDFALNIEELFILSDIFGQLTEKGINIQLFRKAQYRIDNLIHMSSTFRALFHPAKP